MRRTTHDTIEFLSKWECFAEDNNDEIILGILLYLNLRIGTAPSRSTSDISAVEFWRLSENILVRCSSRPVDSEIQE